MTEGHLSGVAADDVPGRSHDGVPEHEEREPLEVRELAVVRGNRGEDDRDDEHDDDLREAVVRPVDPAESLVHARRRRRRSAASPPGITTRTTTSTMNETRFSSCGRDSVTVRFSARARSSEATATPVIDSRPPSTMIVNDFSCSTPKGFVGSNGNTSVSRQPAIPASAVPIPNAIIDTRLVSMPDSAHASRSCASARMARPRYVRRRNSSSSTRMIAPEMNTRMRFQASVIGPRWTTASTYAGCTPRTSPPNWRLASACITSQVTNSRSNDTIGAAAETRRTRTTSSTMPKMKNTGATRNTSTSGSNPNVCHSTYVKKAPNMIAPALARLMI